MSLTGNPYRLISYRSSDSWPIGQLYSITKANAEIMKNHMTRTDRHLSLTERAGLADLAARREFIQNTLNIYKQEFVNLEDFEIKSDTIVGKFHASRYPMTRDGLLNYLTAPLALLYISQLGYIYTHLQFIGALGQDFNTDIFKRDFFQMRDSGNILITNIDKLRFRRKVPLDSDILLKFTPERFLAHRNSFGTRTKFDFCDGAAAGYFTVVLTKGHE